METEFILYVRDQEASRKFYQHVLQLQPTLHVPGMTEFKLGANVKLGLMPESGINKILCSNPADPASGNGIPRCELYLKWGTASLYFSRAVEASAKIISIPSARDWGDTVGYVCDPDGHVLAFAE